MPGARTQPGELLARRLAWEAENPRSEALVRVERAVVRGLAAEFGKGQQFQVTFQDGFDIAVAGTNIVVRVREEAGA